MNAKQKAKFDQRLRHSMATLVGNTNFKDFIEAVREQKDIAVEDSICDRVRSSDRLTCVAAGEVRTYLSILAMYDEALAHQAEANPDVVEE